MSTFAVVLMLISSLTLIAVTIHALWEAATVQLERRRALQRLLIVQAANRRMQAISRAAIGAMYAEEVARVRKDQS